MVIWVVFSLRIFIKLLTNIHIQINLWVYVFIFLGKNGTMESQGRCYICLTLEECVKQVSKVVIPFCIPTFTCSTSSPRDGLILRLAILMGWNGFSRQ